MHGPGAAAGHPGARLVLADLVREELVATRAGLARGRPSQRGMRLQRAARRAERRHHGAMMADMQESGWAKINLALHVRARRSDGYHLIETLFAFVDHGDTIAAAPASSDSLSIDGEFAEGLGNGAERRKELWEEYQQRYGA